MEVQLKELIEKIKKDGVETAESKASGIVKDAEAKAAEIISKANNDAAQITAKAKEDAVKSEQTGEEALKQAGRDLVLNLQTQITDLFNVIIKDEVASAMDEKVLGETIVKLISAWKGDDSKIQVLVSEKDLDKVEKNLKAKLADKIKKGFEVKASKNLDAGFLVSEKDGSAYHNFSAEGIAEVLSDYLNPRLAALVSDGVKEKAEA